MLAFAFTFPALADGEKAGDFDYYVLSLSWSPAWCALDGDNRGGQAQCAEGGGWSFALHGLWPQYEDGWPSWCPTAARDPSRGETAAMADVMGSSGNAWHQWQKHGRCAGLSARDYYALARQAFAAFTVPEVLSDLKRELELPAAVVEAAVLEANPDLSAAMVTVTCKEGLIQEVRLCLAKDLTPRNCAPDTARDCRMTDARLLPVR